MTNSLDNQVITEKKAPLETMNKSGEHAVSKEIQQITAEQLSEYIVMGAEVEGSKRVMEVVSETKSDTTGSTSNRKQMIQAQITQVQRMNQEQLIGGIKKELNREIHELKQQARHIQRSLSHFSAYELNTVLAKIRALREQMISLMHLALEALRELYITLVLKLRIVHI